MKSRNFLFNVLEQLPTPVIITDLKGRITYVNAAFARVTGRPGAELIGKNPRVLSAGITPHRTYQKLWETIMSGRVWKGRIYNRRKNCQVYLESIYISPLRNARGRVTHFLGSWQDITDIKYLEEKLRKNQKMSEEASLKDDLTGLCNRRGFYFLVGQQMKVSRRQKKNMVLLYLDVNHLKVINDSLGHRNGDRALIDAAKLLTSTFRASDIIARIGGDEFAVAAIDSEAEGTRTMLARLEKNVMEFNSSGSPKKYRVEFSVGTVMIKPEEEAGIEALLEKADRSMYMQKKKSQ